MNQETLLVLISQDSKETLELRALYKPILARHREVYTEQEAKKYSLETLVAYTERYQIQTPQDLHERIRLLAECRYLQRQKPGRQDSNGSQDDDWYKAVDKVILDALTKCSPKKVFFSFNSDAISQVSTQLPQAADHPKPLPCLK